MQSFGGRVVVLITGLLRNSVSMSSFANFIMAEIEKNGEIKSVGAVYDLDNSKGFFG